MVLPKLFLIILTSPLFSKFINHLELLMVALPIQYHLKSKLNTYKSTA
ncbi:hypothetical protein PISS_a0665 [Pseudoalteromonas issachenkonii]|uniref:Uncharacterized protein n=1 Tax=Pseudoalteromonas issachenkonii TaxID=152297 RepID=A0ABM6N0H5_9GAMM|nr:hypothetical protein PISS_a0665 [Pseudoalteromonas issachenkonii]